MKKKHDVLAYIFFSVSIQHVADDKKSDGVMRVVFYIAETFQLPPVYYTFHPFHVDVFLLEYILQDAEQLWFYLRQFVFGHVFKHQIQARFGIFVHIAAHLQTTTDKTHRTFSHGGILC